MGSKIPYTFSTFFEQKAVKGSPLMDPLFSDSLLVSTNQKRFL